MSNSRAGQENYTERLREFLYIRASIEETKKNEFYKNNRNNRYKIHCLSSETEIVNSNVYLDQYLNNVYFYPKKDELWYAFKTSKGVVKGKLEASKNDLLNDISRTALLKIISKRHFLFPVTSQQESTLMAIELRLRDKVRREESTDFPDRSQAFENFKMAYDFHHEAEMKNDSRYQTLASSSSLTRNELEELEEIKMKIRVRAYSYMAGIDFKKKVETGKLTKGTKLLSYQEQGSQWQGRYYMNISEVSAPHELGIASTTMKSIVSAFKKNTDKALIVDIKRVDKEPNSKEELGQLKKSTYFYFPQLKATQQKEWRLSFYDCATAQLVSITSIPRNVLDALSAPIINGKVVEDRIRAYHMQINEFKYKFCDNHPLPTDLNSIQTNMYFLIRRNQARTQASMPAAAAGVASFSGSSSASSSSSSDSSNQDEWKLMFYDIQNQRLGLAPLKDYYALRQALQANDKAKIVKCLETFHFNKVNRSSVTKVSQYYETTGEVAYLKSTASPLSDNYSMRNTDVSTTGGGTQYFINDKKELNRIYTKEKQWAAKFLANFYKIKKNAKENKKSDFQEKRANIAFQIVSELPCTPVANTYYLIKHADYNWDLMFVKEGGVQQEINTSAVNRLDATLRDFDEKYHTKTMDDIKKLVDSIEYITLRALIVVGHDKRIKETPIKVMNSPPGLCASASLSGGLVPPCFGMFATNPGASSLEASHSMPPAAMKSL